MAFISDLNAFLLNLADQIKLCKCKYELSNKSDHCLDLEKNNRMKESAKSGCLYCRPDSPLSKQDQLIISKLKNSLYLALTDTKLKMTDVSHLKESEHCRYEETEAETEIDVKLTKRNEKGETPLHIAARTKDLEKIIDMLQKYKVNPNIQDNAGWTPLHEAVFDDNYEIVEQILLAGAIVNVPGFDYMTPLHAATYRQNIRIVNLLLQFGANTTARDINGRLPRDNTADPKILKLLETYINNDEYINIAENFQQFIPTKSTIIIYLTSDKLITTKFKKYLQSKFNLQFSNVLSKGVTHVVVEHFEGNLCKGNFYELKSILMGCVLVNKHWLMACEQHNSVVKFDDFEINGTLKNPSSNGPRKARYNFLKMLPQLFAGCEIFLKNVSNITDIKELVLASGAKLLHREPNPEHTSSKSFLYHCCPGHCMENTITIVLYENGAKEPQLKYNMKHIKALPISWFFHCIETFNIHEPFATL